MSKATKRKHVTREVLEDYILPEENQQILKILGGRGNNLHEAQTSEGDKFLISMPTRFRKNVWIKRGDFVLADPIAEGDKVKAEIVAILYPKQIKYIKQERLWPQGFDTRANESRHQNPEDTEANVDVLTNQLNDASLTDVQVECKDNKTMKEQEEEEDEEDYSSEDNDEDLFVNTNRPTVTFYYSDSSEEEEEEEEEHNQDGTDDDHSADR
ncbi:probable RNA-binding protein EIF1AD [Strongylocentrotus purpuratus]|uniref:Probable RNA-binding protein EIF1AD n=1 Tax=Strongylocentrotus purpuratus TaxID=7668 RepID=A0A7M7RFV1_STRPU|nr:probable RNA-binding protein EIF1AD [Strongylocentrotus purpuratus]